VTHTFHLNFETETHFGECEVECDYKADPEAESRHDRFYPLRSTMQFFEIVLTDKRTGTSEEVDEMPDEIINYAKDAAEEQFEV
jgi:hypothetical protein